MDYPSYIKLKFKDIEFEIGGKEDFITGSLSKLEQTLSILSKCMNAKDSSSGNLIKDSTEENVKIKPSIEEILKQDFSIWRNYISDDPDDIFSFVFGGYYLQLNSKNDFFTTKQVFSLLYEHGILINDVRKCENQNLNAKNIVKVGTTKGEIKYRVTEDAKKLLDEILELNYL